MPNQYTDEELLDMIRRCKEKHGVATPSLFNSMDSTCSPSTPMRRFGSWDEARTEAGIEEDNTDRTGRKKQYTDADVLRDIRKCHDKHGKATVSLMNEEQDLVAPSVAEKRFGSWREAKEEAGVKKDDREDNHRPRVYSDEDYYDLLQRCEEKHGKVTQSTFDDDDEFPSSGAVAQRFESWSKAKQLAGVESSTTSYTNEELLEQLAECQRRYEYCSADKFAQDDDFAAPETAQRRFESWKKAKEKARESAVANDIDDHRG